MKRHDKVLFHWGFEDYECGVIREISPDGLGARVKHGPWMFAGHWITIDNRRNFRIHGRTWWGKLMDRVPRRQ